MLKYPKVHDATSNIMQNLGLLEGDILVESKRDGSLWRLLLKKDGTIKTGSKKVDDIAIIEDDKLSILKDQPLFDTAIQRTYELRDKIREVLSEYFFEQNKDFEEIYLFTEYIKTNKHNVLTYKRVPKNNMVLFDIIAVDNKNRVIRIGKNENDKWIKLEIAKKIGLEETQIMYEGEWQKGMLQELLKQEDALGGTIVEGVVVKNYNKTYPIDLISTKSYFGFPVVGKFVREDFKEKLDKEWNVKKKQESMQGIIEALLTEARLNKAIQHLKEEGKIQNEKRDLAELIPEFINDTIEEERQWIEKQLWKVFEREFKLKAQRFVVKKYLERLEKSI